MPGELVELSLFKTKVDISRIIVSSSEANNGDKAQNAVSWLRKTITEGPKANSKTDPNFDRIKMNIIDKITVEYINRYQPDKYLLYSLWQLINIIPGEKAINQMTKLVEDLQYAGNYQEIIQLMCNEGNKLGTRRRRLILQCLGLLYDDEVSFSDSLFAEQPSETGTIDILDYIGQKLIEEHHIPKTIFPDQYEDKDKELLISLLGALKRYFHGEKMRVAMQIAANSR